MLKAVTEASGNWWDMGKEMRYFSTIKIAPDHEEVERLVTICGRTNKH